MRKSLVLAAAALVAMAGGARAQTLDPQCSASDVHLQDACQKAIDVFNFMAPQLGTSIAGGNATLGQGGTLGGLGHFTVGLRANLVAGTIPQVDQVQPSTTGPQQSDYQTSTQPIGLPEVDAAIGVFKGLPLGLTNIGGIDLLATASYLPEVSKNSVAVQTPNGSLKLGFGARIGLLQESLLVPGVSFTYMMRSLPEANIIGTTNVTGGVDTIAVNNLDVKTNAWRLVASKSLIFFGLAVGVGQDHYKSSADMYASVADPTCAGGRCSGTPFNFDQSLTRTNVFGDAYINILLVKLVGEVGMVSGGTVNTYNTFGGKKADDSRVYGSVGLRVGF